MSPHSASSTTNDLVNEYADIIKGKIILTTGVTPNSLGGTFIHETASKSPSLLILAGLPGSAGRPSVSGEMTCPNAPLDR